MKFQVAAATDRRNLRLFSSGGMQKEVLSLPGPVVALSGYENKLMVTVHLSMPLPGNQCIGTAIFNVADMNHSMPNFSLLPLAPKSILSWQGFTDEGVPSIMDSAGYIRILPGTYGSCWVQVCDSKAIAKGKSDHYFMLGANLKEYSARCILVKGSRFPATLPKPVVSVLKLKLPLCGQENDKFANEQNYWKARIISSAIDDSETKESMELVETEALIKLFAHACQLDQDTRAIDICKLMSSKGLQLAITYAKKNRKMALAGKLGSLAFEKQQEEERQEQEQQQESYRNYAASQASVDLFASQEDDIELEPAENPLLAAEARKDTATYGKSFITPTQSSGNRNPFKKSATPSSASSSNRAGIVFDEIAKSDVMKSASGKKSSSFGSRKIETPTSSRLVTLGKKVEKENKSSNSGNLDGGGGKKVEPLKGFLLWYEENSQQVSEEESILDNEQLHAKCLEKWQSLSSDAKKAYKTPRIPKRKRSENSGDQTSTKSKLAKFAM